MKTALLTFHNAINYGAALQVFSAQKAIQDLGHTCDVIDYVNSHRKNSYNMFYHAKEEIKNKNLKKAMIYYIGSIFMYKRTKKFERFYRENLNLTSTIYHSSEELRSINNSYDKFIVGSDQVWNYNNNGRDFAYLLDFVEEDRKKISYSSSFGIADIPNDLIERYKYYFNKIPNLSTREEYGVKLIKELTGRGSVLVLDPVFLLSKDKWLEIASKQENEQKYLFFYTNKNNQLENFIDKSKIPTNEYKIHKLTGHLSPLDIINRNVKVRYSMSPNEFISEINNAALVVTASFHCVAISIILNKPFVAIITGDKGKDERVLNILRLLGLEDRIFNENMTLDDIYKPIDYELVNHELRIYIDSSIKYLRNSINS